jgi:hypothetical protein
MLGHLEINELRLDIESELAHCAFTPLLGREIKPIIARTSRIKSRVTHTAPWPFQINRANNLPVSVSVLYGQRAADFLGEITNQFFDRFAIFSKSA